FDPLEAISPQTLLVHPDKGSNVLAHRNYVHGDPDAALHEVKVDLPSGDQVVSLSKPLWIVGTVRLTSGDLNLSGFDLDLGTTGELVESPGSTVRGTLGSVRAERNLVVPIGENVGGTGAIITSQMSLGLTTLVRGHAFQILDGPQGIRRFYDIMPPMNTQLDATFTFSYDESELSGLSETDLQLFRSEDMGLTWTRVGGDVDTTANTVTITGVDSFSRWTLGSGVRVGIDESDPLPSTVRLDQNFPNPFNSYTTIQFALPKAEQVTLIVFNLLGQKVRTLLMQEARPAGVHRLPFDGQNDAGLELTSGIYVYQLKAGDFIHSKKLLLLK
ncbi:MAG: T9SS type A sorting domain-containing protein, partial [Bacteroidetes bacterium]|nr:T9SS type A sorting domain-containing protein [Bacteroidota bacterium]